MAASLRPPGCAVQRQALAGAGSARGGRIRGVRPGWCACLVVSQVAGGRPEEARAIWLGGRRDRCSTKEGFPGSSRLQHALMPMTVQCVSAEADGLMRGMRLSRRLSRTQARSAASRVSFAVQRLTPPAITAPTSTPTRPTIRRYWNCQHRHRNRLTISCSPWSPASRPGNPLRAAGLRFASSAMVKL
jgi:hypothetical protein